MENTELPANSPEGQEPNQNLNSAQSNVWEENHKKIMDCMHKFMQRKLSIPTVSFISQETGISRFTVRKHIGGCFNQADYQEHTGMFKFMTTNILRQLYSQSMYGEVRAAKLYMQLMGVLDNNKLVENNFISTPPKTLTFDGVAITEEFLNNLSAPVYAKLAAVIKEGIDENQNGRRIAS